MRITAATNLLVRVLVQDDPEQARTAMDLLRGAELVAVPLPLPVLCELAWVLKRVYRLAAVECVVAIEALLATRTVVTDRPAVRAGLRLLADGGDFADAVIAFSGRRLGGECFVSFDRRAVQLLADLGEPAELLQAGIPPRASPPALSRLPSAHIGPLPCSSCCWVIPMPAS